MMFQTTTHRVIHLWVDPVFGLDSGTNSAATLNPAGQVEVCGSVSTTINLPNDKVDTNQGSSAFLLHAPWPFKTISAAVAYLPTLPTQPSAVTGVVWERAIIHLMPGMYMKSTTIYTPNGESGNGEGFPIHLPNNVSIQGTSALNTILDLEGWRNAGLPNGPAFWFGATAGTTGKNSFIDSVSILGAIREDETNTNRPELGSAIYLDPAHASSPTITNCFIFSNELGITIDAPLGVSSFHEPTIINNSFVWNDIGIWNGQRAALGSNPPVNSVGVSQLIVINNILDATPPTTANCPTYPIAVSDFQYRGKSDFEGLDFSDMTIASPGAGNYNAFEAGALGTNNYDYQTALVPGLPPTFVRAAFPAVAASRNIASITGFGTANARRGILYVRDLLCNAPATIFPAWSQTGFDRSPIDFRLSPAVTNATTSGNPTAPGLGSLNPLVDNGWFHDFTGSTVMSMPAPNSTRTMTSPPGYFALPTAAYTWPFHSWDEDAEGFGNPRARDHPVYPNNGYSGFPFDPPIHLLQIDIGADELGELSGVGYRMGTTSLLSFVGMGNSHQYPAMDNKYLWYLGPPATLAGNPPQKDKPMHRWSLQFGQPPQGPWIFPPWWGTWDHRTTQYYVSSMADTNPHLIPDIHPWWRVWFSGPPTPTNPFWRSCTVPTYYNQMLFQNPTAGVVNPGGTNAGYVSTSLQFSYLDGTFSPTWGGFWYLGRSPNPALGGPINGGSAWGTKSAFSLFDNWCRANDAQATPGVKETFPVTYDPTKTPKDPITALRFSLEVANSSTWTPTGALDPLFNSNIQTFLIVREKASQ